MRALRYAPLALALPVAAAHAEGTEPIDPIPGMMYSAMQLAVPALGLFFSFALLGELIGTYMVTEVIGAMIAVAIETGAAGGVAGFIAMNVVTIAAISFVAVGLISIGVIGYYALPALANAVGVTGNVIRSGGGLAPDGMVDAGCCGDSVGAVVGAIPDGTPDVGFSGGSLGLDVGPVGSFGEFADGQDTAGAVDYGWHDGILYYYGDHPWSVAYTLSASDLALLPPGIIPIGEEGPDGRTLATPNPATLGLLLLGLAAMRLRTRR